MQEVAGSTPGLDFLAGYRSFILNIKLRAEHQLGHY
jgi:hypothetical protein